MKTLILALIISTSAFAVDCEVDGISDSPQKYSCIFKDGKRIETLHLLCVDGKYQIQWLGKVLDVSVAYHEEVETGSNPLVFIADQLTLTTISKRARIVEEGRESLGTCSDK